MNKKIRNYLQEVFQPEFFKLIKERNYSRKTFISDLTSGIIVGIVAIPLAIAFGIASGVSPQQGLITAIIAGFIISFFGGSSVQIGGPTGAFIVIIFGIVTEFGINGLIIATVLAGIMLVLIGLFKFGNIIKFIPYPIIVGFTSGIAIVIFTSQIKDFFGLTMTEVPSEFVDKWGAFFRSFHTINWWATGISILTILLIVFIPRFIKKAPSALIAIVLLTVIAYFLKSIYSIDIDTIGSKFPELSGGAPLPTPEAPKIDAKAVRMLFPAAFTIAMLGAIESLLSAMVADGVTGKKHNSNTELIAQGIANIFTPFFGGIPATGAIARTMTNINNGGKTPVSGIIHAIFLLLVYLFLMPLAVHIPLACLAGVLAVVSYNMSEWRSFKLLLKGPKADVIVLLTTFFLTVVFDLTIAIEIGLLLAVVLFLKRVSETSKISMLEKELSVSENPEAEDVERLDIPLGVEVYEINGPFFFGLANKFEEIDSRTVKVLPIVRIIRMRRVPFIDSTGINNLRNLYKRSLKSGITLVLSGVTSEVYETLKTSGIVNEIGKENICNHISLAIKRTEEILKEKSIEE
ncbi:sulfate permease [Bacteroidales bacterium OttesenSCG-928-C19]|nr:sulfate permease [Bacteroidales bacterium OttesenSCG-928-C19]